MNELPPTQPHNDSILTAMKGDACQKTSTEMAARGHHILKDHCLEKLGKVYSISFFADKGSQNNSATLQEIMKKIISRSGLKHKSLIVSYLQHK